MAFEAENRELREQWFEKYWGGRLDAEGIEIPNGAAVLQEMGVIPRLTTDAIEARNKNLRDKMFAERWGGRLVYEDVEISDGALVLQQMGVIPRV